MFSQFVAVVLVSGMVSAALAQPGVPVPVHGDDPKFARIISLQNDLDTSGAFSYSYETENGIKAEAHGVLNNAGIPEKEEQVVTGSFSFVDNGKVYSVTYVADGNGFRAFGDHIPSSDSTPLPFHQPPPSHQPSPPPSYQPSPPPSYQPSPSPSYQPSPPQSHQPSPPQSHQPSPPRSSLPRPQEEVDDLARWQWDPQGLTPPPLASPVLFPVYSNPLPAELVFPPSARNPRRRKQEYLETVIY